MPDATAAARSDPLASAPGDADHAPPSRFAEFRRSYAQSRGALFGLSLVVLLVLVAIFADVISPHPPNEQYRDFTLTPPMWDAGGTARFVLGTDPVGRDMLSRLIHGARLSLLIGVISVAISLGLGIRTQRWAW
jgi:dipeptide transport system permease protein